MAAEAKLKAFISTNLSKEEVEKGEIDGKNRGTLALGIKTPEYPAEFFPQTPVDYHWKDICCELDGNKKEGFDCGGTQTH